MAGEIPRSIQDPAAGRISSIWGSAAPNVCSAEGRAFPRTLQWRPPSRNRASCAPTRASPASGRATAMRSPVSAPTAQGFSLVESTGESVRLVNASTAWFDVCLVVRPGEHREPDDDHDVEQDEYASTKSEIHPDAHPKTLRGSPRNSSVKNARGPHRLLPEPADAVARLRPSRSYCGPRSLRIPQTRGILVVCLYSPDGPLLM
jgi:hypothetical protein